jgi:hypothetical protein
MTMLQKPIVAAQCMSEEDAEIALGRVIAQSGFTLPELRKQATECEFHSLHARLAWIAIQAIEKV